jgi:transcription elongation factor GreB
VRLEDEDGASSVFRIVGPDEFDSTKGFISMESPMAKALMGREEGDEVTVRRPKGTAVFTIVEIAYEPIGAR